MGGTKGGCRAVAPPQASKTEIKKKTYFIDMMISNVLRDVLFSRTQHMKSADDLFIRILRNILMKFKKEEYRAL